VVCPSARYSCLVLSILVLFPAELFPFPLCISFYLLFLLLALLNDVKLIKNQRAPPCLFSTVVPSVVFVFVSPLLPFLIR
jgi:hypothetical protein